MSSVNGRKPPSFLHHNQIFDVTIEKRDYDVKNLISPTLTRNVDKVIFAKCMLRQCLMKQKTQ